MKNEVCTRGGQVTEILSHATHLIPIVAAQTAMDFGALLNSISPEDRCLINFTRLQIVESRWLEDCFQQGKMLPEKDYSLKPQGFQESLTNSQYDQDIVGEQFHEPETGPNDGSCTEKVETQSGVSENPRLVTWPSPQGKRKVSARLSERRKKPDIRSRGLGSRPLVRCKPTKIHEHESDDGALSPDGKKKTETTMSVSANTRSDNVFGDAETSQAKRKRAHIRSKPAIIVGDGSDYDDASHEDQTKKRNSADTEPEDSTLPSEKPEVQHHESGNHEDYSQKAREDGCIISLNKNQVERTMDPVETMLLQMVPALREKQVETANPAPNVSNEITEPGEPSSLDSDMIPAKKKKVSYKDMASQLLKNW